MNFLDSEGSSASRVVSVTSTASPRGGPAGNPPRGAEPIVIQCGEIIGRAPDQRTSHSHHSSTCTFDNNDVATVECTKSCDWRGKTQVQAEFKLKADAERHRQRLAQQHGWEMAVGRKMRIGQPQNQEEAQVPAEPLSPCHPNGARDESAQSLSRHPSLPTRPLGEPHQRLAGSSDPTVGDAELSAPSHQRAISLQSGARSVDPDKRAKTWHLPPVSAGRQSPGPALRSPRAAAPSPRLDRSLGDAAGHPPPGDLEAVRARGCIDAEDCPARSRRHA